MTKCEHFLDRTTNGHSPQTEVLTIQEDNGCK